MRDVNFLVHLQRDFRIEDRSVGRFFCCFKWKEILEYFTRDCQRLKIFVFLETKSNIA
jgi:hypothetical protein